MRKQINTYLEPSSSQVSLQFGMFQWDDYSCFITTKEKVAWMEEKLSCGSKSFWVDRLKPLKRLTYSVIYSMPTNTKPIPLNPVIILLTIQCSSFWETNSFYKSNVWHCSHRIRKPTNLGPFSITAFQSPKDVVTNPRARTFRRVQGLKFKQQNNIDMFINYKTH